MRRIFGSRASSILYNWLISNDVSGEVLMAANICETVPGTYYKAGIKLNFCDIDFKTFQPDSQQIEDYLTRNRKINILHYNHTYGCIMPNEKEFLKSLKEKFPNLIIIEDRCLSIPDLEIPEVESHLVLYSTGNTKFINIGFGGFAFTSDEWKYEHEQVCFLEKDLLAFENHVRCCHNNALSIDYSIIGSNWISPDLVMDDGEYFKKIKIEYEKSLVHKMKINEIYNNFLTFCSMGNEYQNWRYNILVKNKEYCVRKLFENGLFASSHYKSLGSGYFTQQKYSVCDWLESHVINLFNDFCYDADKAYNTAMLLCDIADSEIVAFK